MEFFAYLSTFLFVLLFCVFPTPQQVVATPGEDQFVNLYGNDVNTSGIWQYARELESTNPDKLRNISHEAHMTVWPYYRGGIKVDKAFVTTRTLIFQNRTYKDINIDLIAYKIEGLAAPTFYLSKGVKPGCLIYCWKVPAKWGNKWSLQNEVCDLSL